MLLASVSNIVHVIIGQQEVQQYCFSLSTRWLKAAGCLDISDCRGGKQRQGRTHSGVDKLIGTIDVRQKAKTYEHRYHPHKNYFCHFCCWKLTWTSESSNFSQPLPEFDNQVGLSPWSELRTRTAQNQVGCQTWRGRTAAPWTATPRRPSPSSAFRELSVGQRSQEKKLTRCIRQVGRANSAI